MSASIQNKSVFTASDGKKHQFASREEWAAAQNRKVQAKTSRQNSAMGHRLATHQAAEGEWVTMGSGGKSRPRNTTELDEASSDLRAKANDEAAAAAAAASRVVKSPLEFVPTKGKWKSVTNLPIHFASKKSTEPQIVLTPIKNEPPTSSGYGSAIRKTRGWVGRVVELVGCKICEVDNILQAASSDCDGRPGSQHSRDIIAAAAGRASTVLPPVSMPVGRFGALQVEECPPSRDMCEFPCLVEPQRRTQVSGVWGKGAFTQTSKVVVPVAEATFVPYPVGVAGDWGAEAEWDIEHNQ